MRTFALIVALLAVTAGAAAQEAQKKGPVVGYKDTPMLPDGKWHIHDSDRPLPRVVTPGSWGSEDTPGKPPSDAVVLFDGKDLSKWQTPKGDPAGWQIENGCMIATPRKLPGGGDIQTRDQFGDCQLHIEFATPAPPKGDSQGRGNSGAFLMGKYEIQVLDSFDNRTYADGQAAALYGQYPPLVNACRKPGEWQTYDIIFTAPRFKDGQLESPAYVTLLHNGLLVHNHTALLGPSGHKSLPKYTPHDPKGIIRLQDHGNPVRFRNIWIRELKGYDEQ